VIDTFPWYGDHGLADAGMHSTPGDLARFLRALLTTDELLGGDMRREMTSVPLPGRAPSGYGLGILVHRDLAGGGPAYSHDGRDPGYEADMLHFAGPGLTIAACANASLGRASRVYDRLITRVVHASLAAVDARH
jgi:CubicO group peptidase (beta-lactamase class C family)